jgi:ribosomal protein S18 acetylase RimI-like enzyme
MLSRRYRPEDRAAVISVLSESIPEWDGDWAERYWEWKFERNPHGEALVWVGDDNGRIAGCYIWNRVRIRLGGTTMLGAQSVDAATHRDYRGRGLFTDLARIAKEEVAESDLALVYAFPVEAAFRGQVRIGFEPRLTVSPIHRPLLAGPLRRRLDDFVLEDSRGFGSEFDVFSQQERDGQLRVDRDAAYLRWRYDEHPTRTYETIVCRRGEELCGYCVLRVEPGQRIARGFVVDLEVLPGFEAAAAFLVDHALRRLRSRGARVAISWPRPSGAEQEALEARGFSPRYHVLQSRLRRSGYEPQFLVYETERFREQGGSAGPTPARWSLVPGDHDSM